MAHMVIFRTAEGKPGYHQAEALDEAVRFVEHLRNQEQVPEARIFRMQEVPIEFKTYVKVEVSSPVQDEAPVAPAPVAAAPVVAPVAPVAPVAAAPVVPAPVLSATVLSAPVDEPRAAKLDDVVVDPMPVSGAGAANGRFGRFNRG
jgi:hypothetical protein